MLQELALQTGATTSTIASMLFFLAVFLLIVWLVARAPAAELEARRRLPFDDQPEGRR